MANIFISYSSKDENFARRLAEDLIRLGHEPWFDKWQIKVGECIPSKIEHAISKADYVVIILSSSSVKSGWVDREWKTKYWEEIKQNKTLVLPVLIEDCEIPPLLKTKKYADFRIKYAIGLVELTRAISPVIKRVPVSVEIKPTYYSSDISTGSEEGEPQKERAEREDTSLLIKIVVIALIILVGVYFYLGGWKFLISTEVKITYPNNGSIVEINEIVKGTSQDVPKEHAIWVVVYSHVDEHYYPQSNPAEVQIFGKWSSSSYIGNEEDVGKKFDIIAVVVNKEAQDAFKAYFTQAWMEKTYPGFDKLPEGSTTYDRISVTRSNFDVEDTYIRGFDLLIFGKIDESEEAFRIVYKKYPIYKSADEILSLFEEGRRNYEESEKIKIYILNKIIEEELVAPSNQQLNEIKRIISKK